MKKFPVDLSLIESKCRSMLTLPGNKIRGFNYIEGDDGNDTAFYNFKDNYITITDKLMNTLSSNIDEPAIPQALEGILMHEAIHSLATQLLPNWSKLSYTENFFFNHFEDWRVNQTAISWQPSLSNGLKDTYYALSRSRSQTKRDNSTQSEFMDFIDKVDDFSYKSNFDSHLDYLTNNNDYNEETKDLLLKCTPIIKKIVSLKPDPFDSKLTFDNSTHVSSHILTLLDLLNPYFNFEQEKPKSKSVDELLKEINDILDKRKPQTQKEQSDNPSQEQGGSGSEQNKKQSDNPSQEQGGSGNEQNKEQSGNPSQESSDKKPDNETHENLPNPASKDLEKLSDSELKNFKEILEKLKEDPHGPTKGYSNAEERDKQEIVKGSNDLKSTPQSGGYGATEAKTKTSQHTQVSNTEYSKFVHDYYSLITSITRSFSNRDDRVALDGPSQNKNSKQGHLLNTRNISKFLTQPVSGEPPPFFKNPHLTESKGNKIWKLEKLFFSIDGSYSMDRYLPLVRTFLALLYESARRAKIPVAISVAYDGRPTIISTGTYRDKPQEVIKKILAISAQGGTNISEGSLKSLFDYSKGVHENAGRLIMVTDCETSASDLKLLSSYSKQLKFPATILGVGSEYNIKEASDYFKEAGPTIGTTSNANDKKSMQHLFKKFALWMKDPDKFRKQHPQLCMINKNHIEL